MRGIDAAFLVFLTINLPSAVIQQTTTGSSNTGTVTGTAGDNSSADGKPVRGHEAVGKTESRSGHETETTHKRMRKD